MKKTTGQHLVSLSKSPFVDDEWLANSIDMAISQAVKKAKDQEHDRIEKLLGTIDDKRVAEVLKLARFKHTKYKEKKANEKSF